MTPTAILSPELALVDEHLAAAARERMQTPSVRFRTAAVDHARDPHPAAAPARSRLRRGRHTIAAGFLALMLVMLPGSATEGHPSWIPFWTGAAEQKSEGHAISWRKQADADVYNLILYRGDRRFDFWPTTDRLPLVTKDGRPVVPPGSYSWFVYAGFREGTRMRYGPLLDHGKLDLR